MSHSSRESEFAQLREALAQINSEYFFTLKERRAITLKIQERKGAAGRFSHYDPDREKEIFTLFVSELKILTMRELLSFSLVMEDHASAMAPGSYPAWSSSFHLSNHHHELFEMINPLMLKFSRPEFFSRLTLTQEFGFLKDF